MGKGHKKNSRRSADKRGSTTVFGRSLFDAYYEYNDMQANKEGSVSGVNRAESIGQGNVPRIPFVYEDTALAADIIKDLAAMHKWSADQVEADLRSLAHNRLRTAGELRCLSKRSWEVVELLPLVKDLLLIAIGAQVASSAGGTHKRGGVDRHAVNSGSSSSDSNDESSSGESPRGPHRQVWIGGLSAKGSKRKAQSAALGPGRQVSTSRMVVANDIDGKLYEVDRFCPHKQYDMAKKSIVVQGQLICPKHDWAFDLAAGGACRSKCASIHAVCLGEKDDLQW